MIINTASLYIEPLKYSAEFRHVEYVNPNAPKGGTLRFPELGTFDNFNVMVDKGRRAFGSELLGIRAITSDSLIEPSYDEPSSFYGRLADGIWISDDYREFAFRIRENAKWHDGTPLTVDDVVFTFRHYKEKGNAGIRTALADLDRVEKIGEREVYFSVKKILKEHQSFPLLSGRSPYNRKLTGRSMILQKPPLFRPSVAGLTKLKSLSLVDMCSMSAWMIIGVEKCR